MRIKLKSLDEQVIVITGATSGIGLVTARLAATRGARLMLVSRDETALTELVRELSRDAHDRVAHAVADVGDRTQLQAAADAAIQRFGGFDTWINNAGVSIYGRCADVPLDEQRKLFDTNFWGVVNGSLIAVQHLREKGGALINLGSELSDVAVPLQGAYVASKHAVKGYTDALRIELANEGAPVSVTLVKPAGVDTLFVEHARNHLDRQPKLPQPVYAPDVVARAILHAAVHPTRDIYAGGASRGMAWFGRSAPRVYDAILSKLGVKAQLTDEPRRDGDALDRGGADLRERSGRHGRVRERSFYTDAYTLAAGPRAALIGIAGVMLVAAAGRYLREAKGHRISAF
ncbi:MULTISPECIES: SDR family oxidoreductase [unclassified Caballeronia]|jgi:short-subunit dehydrogenase|uniref:SDR family oxidoreductase n=1 Tax=unclassified Caballeronia TaxID=2646786 RepID=UPI0020277C91|nr:MULTISPECIES: SDR family oxidoreductase [unclassified Caballeronia]